MDGEFRNADYHGGYDIGPWLVGQGLKQMCTLKVNSAGIHIRFDVDGSTALLDWEYLSEGVQKEMQRVFDLPDSWLTYHFQIMVAKASHRLNIMSQLADSMGAGSPVILRQRAATGGQEVQFIGMSFSPRARERLHPIQND